MSEHAMQCPYCPAHRAWVEMEQHIKATHPGQEVPAEYALAVPESKEAAVTESDVQEGDEVEVSRVRRGTVQRITRSPHGHVIAWVHEETAPRGQTFPVRLSGDPDGQELRVTKRADSAAELARHMHWQHLRTVAASGKDRQDADRVWDRMGDVTRRYWYEMAKAALAWQQERGGGE